MSFVLPRPKSETTDEVVLSREDWERIVAALGSIDEDEDDIAAVAAARADDARFAAHVAAERGVPVEVTIPIEVIEARLDGAHPVKAWREHREWTQLYLSFKSGVGRDLIAQIETHRKKGSIETLSRLARALGVPIEALTEEEAV
jgi:DNA-binding XRE family transcriptional regulator